MTMKNSMKLVKGTSFLGANHVIFQIDGNKYRGTLYGLKNGLAHVRSRCYSEMMVFTDIIFDKNLTTIPKMKDRQVLIISSQTSLSKEVSDISEKTPNIFWDKTFKLNY